MSNPEGENPEQLSDILYRLSCENEQALSHILAKKGVRDDFLHPYFTLEYPYHLLDYPIADIRDHLKISYQPEEIILDPNFRRRFSDEAINHIAKGFKLFSDGRIYCPREPRERPAQNNIHRIWMKPDNRGIIMRMSVIGSRYWLQIDTHLRKEEGYKNRGSMLMIGRKDLDEEQGLSAMFFMDAQDPLTDQNPACLFAGNNFYDMGFYYATGLLDIRRELIPELSNYGDDIDHPPIPI